MKCKSAFTVIELIFVIVVLGILATVALPKFAGVKEQADVAKGKGDVATIRAGIVNERQTRLIKGCASYIPNGTGTFTCGSSTHNAMDNGGLFGGVLTQGFPNSATRGNWSATAGSGTYLYWVGSASTQFDYNATSGSFGCTAGAGYCNQLTN